MAPVVHSIANVLVGRGLAIEIGRDCTGVVLLPTDLGSEAFRVLGLHTMPARVLGGRVTA
jgi:hypothetical protein